MKAISPVWLADALGSAWQEALPEWDIKSICIDSRQITPGGLFFAFRGEQVDGHDFLPAIAGKGGAAVIAAAFPAEKIPAGLSHLRVPDPRAALLQLGAAYRRLFDLPILGITGSSGKTTTRRLLAAMLGGLGKTAQTLGNFNNEIGLPLSLFELDSACRFGVFEAGISHPHDMEPLQETLRPTAALFTPPGRGHMEFFASVEEVAVEKAKLARELPQEGFVVLGDGARERAYLTYCAGRRAVICSFAEESADYSGRIEGDVLRIAEKASGETASLPIPAPGGFMAENVLRAAAMARQLGATWQHIEEGCRNYSPLSGRWAVETIGAWTVVNDAYNANPESMNASLDAFQHFGPPEAPHFLVLGPMLELGAGEAAAHRALGERLAGENWAGMVLLPRMGKTQADDSALRVLSEALLQRPHVRIFETPDAAAEYLAEQMPPGSYVLFKASRGVAAERVIPLLKERAGC